METAKLKKFASFARSALIEQVGTRLKTVLSVASLARRESSKVVEELEKKIKELGEKRVVEMVAYTWFNRFCALRYMDVNRYTRIGVLSPADGQFQPEILAEAKMGHIDEELVPEATRKQVMRLLDGSDKSADPQGEAYRLLLVAVCNYYHSLMPFMFEKIADYTELLLPDDLLSGTSIPAYTREALLPINCSPEHTEESVEVIGWLYQFYIADKKDEVFDGLKKGKKITAENIPAATQLFTPHWIVRYLVENSLGRLWMLNHPDSKLVERMDYYIDPVSDKALAVGSSDPDNSTTNPRLAPSGSQHIQETDFLKIASPEEIKVCDPACGSGHMLTYAFDLLYEIYREEQYPEPEIPSLILKNNLYGIEIDPRAGALAAFALTMKAREKDKRFFTRKPQPDASARDSSSIENSKSRIPNPNICVLENIKIDPEDLSAYMDKVGRDLFTGGLQVVVNQWEEAENFGSLIRPIVTDVSEVLERLRERQMGQDLFLASVHQQVLKALRQADYLSSKYHVVIANPPYMGSSGMNPDLKDFISKQTEAAKADTYAAFMLRNVDLIKKYGLFGMITIPNWMFLSSFKELRAHLLETTKINSLVHCGRGVWGADFGSCAFVFCRDSANNKGIGTYRRLFHIQGEVTPGEELVRRFFDTSSFPEFKVTQASFDAIPDSPIAYWASDAFRAAYKHGNLVENFLDCRIALATADNNRFLRQWYEVSLSRIGFGIQSEEATVAAGHKWFPCNKGGDFRKWYGNQDTVVNWENNGAEIRTFTDERTGRIRSHNYNGKFGFQECLTWSAISSSKFGLRYSPSGFMFVTPGSCAFTKNDANVFRLLSLLASNVAERYLRTLSTTVNIEVGTILKIPVLDLSTNADDIAKQCVAICKDDWDRIETSFDFQVHPLVAAPNQQLEDACTQLQRDQNDEVCTLQRLEEKNNAGIIELYGFSKEQSPNVAREELTLNCNPHYRYGSDKSESELESLLLADTMREFISYAVGCMFGRYSLDQPGLVLANQGETVSDYRKQVPEPTFAPEDDNVIPILEGEWFSDDISQRFKDFLKVTFGTALYNDNLEFLENALYPDNPIAKKRKTIRDYFLKEFYDHHLKMYKKRPIYWMFSSPKGTFNALIYMHRYRSETVGKVLECLRDFRDKLAHQAEQRQGVADSASESKTEKTKAIKDVVVIKKQLKELEEYEKALFEVAAKKISIDLDDGVKHNYPLFGSVLRKLPGLEILDS